MSELVVHNRIATFFHTSYPDRNFVSDPTLRKAQGVNQMTHEMLADPLFRSQPYIFFALRVENFFSSGFRTDPGLEFE
jgi:hypothetical protein